MKKNLLKLLTLVLALVMVVTVFAGCKKPDEETDAPTQGSEETPTETQEQPADEYKPSAAQLLNGKEWGKDFTELYDEIGDKVTTIGGIVGIVCAIADKDDTLVIETGSDRTKIRFRRSAISSVEKLDTGKDSKSAPVKK